MYRPVLIAAALFAIPAAACAQDAGDYATSATPEGADLPDGLAHAVFASGCFWCTEADFEKLDGVVEVVSGFAGGTEENPGYYDVVYGRTSHSEAARVIYDPEVVSYQQLLDHYWVNVDPFDREGQFCDRGGAYAPHIFPINDEQQALAAASAEAVEARFERNVAVDIELLTTFWPAEANHQNFADTNPIRYQRYRFGCRRDQRLRQIWGDEALGG